MPIWDILLDTLLDSLKTLPFLFLVYLLMEFLEHRASDRLTHTLSHAKGFSIPLGGVLGLVPQCGMSVAVANLYTGRVVSVGTMLAVFIATSDEAVPVLLSHPEGAARLLPLLGLKLFWAVLGGFVAELLFTGLRKTSCSNDCHHDTERKERARHFCQHCGCENSIFRSALRHTVKTFLFLVAVVLFLNVITQAIGEDRLSAFLTGNAVWAPFLSALVGLIPNCAPSVIISELYFTGALSLGSTVAGLSAGAGLGLAVLLRMDRDVKKNLLILVYLYGFSVTAGIVTDLLLALLF